MSEVATYLKDHLAGSVGALELLDHLIAVQKIPAEAQFYRELRAEIHADQGVLISILERFGLDEGAVRKTTGWFMEKVGWIKLSLSDLSADGAGRLQALEMLAIGIAGKRLLWEALAAAPAMSEKLTDLNFDRLIERAGAQIARVNGKHTEVARRALRFDE